MERERDDNPLADGTGMDRPDELPAMPSADGDSRGGNEAPGGDETTAVEGASAVAATQRAWGTQPPGAVAGIGTHVPTDGDEHAAEPAGEGEDSTDPRGL